MSQFSDIVDQVYTITNRPDLVAETSLFVRQATLDAHRSDKYPRDRQELSLTMSAPASLIQISIPDNFPNWRQFTYIRPFDSVTLTPSADVILGQDEFIQPEAIFDEYLAEKTNVAYVGGNNLNIRFAAKWAGLIVGYYSNPVVAPDANYSSWVATDFPAVVVIDAARRVLQSIGYEEAAARLTIMLYGSPPGNYSQPTGGEYATFKQSALESIGR